MRIVHLSDLHLRHHLPGSSTNPARLSRAMPGLLERAVGHIASLQPDLFVLTGDLVDYPLERMDDPLLRAQALKDLALIAGLLRRIPCPIALVYGNHDHPQLFHQIFGPVTVDQRVNGYRILSFLDDEGPNNVPLRDGPQRERFAGALATTEHAPQIHVQHYLVWPERNDSYPHTYGDGASLTGAILASGNVRLVLSGHYHAGVEPARIEGVWFATVPAFGEFPHPFWVYELSAAGLSWVQHELAVPRRD